MGASAGAGNGGALAIRRRYDGGCSGPVAVRRRLRLEAASFAAEKGPARSLRCDGVETAGVLDEASPLSFPQGFTMAVWVRPDRLRRYDPVVGRPNPSNPAWTTPAVGLYIDSGRPVFGLFRTGRLLLEGPALALQAWSLVVVTADGKQVVMFVDGKLVAKTKQTFPVPDAGGLPWYVRRSGSRYFRGWIGELALWTRALAADEVASAAESTAARYPRSVAKATVPRDRTVSVASPGSTADGMWSEDPTRTREGLDGFTPSSPHPIDRWGGLCVDRTGSDPDDLANPMTSAA